MIVKAKICFCGKISMYAGEIRDIEDGEVLTDLLASHYVEKFANEPTKHQLPQNKNIPPPKKTKK